MDRHIVIMAAAIVAYLASITLLIAATIAQAKRARRNRIGVEEICVWYNAERCTPSPALLKPDSTCGVFVRYARNTYARAYFDGKVFRTNNGQHVLWAVTHWRYEPNESVFE